MSRTIIPFINWPSPSDHIVIFSTPYIYFMFCNYPYDLVYYKCTTYCTWGSSSCCEIIIAKWLHLANSQLVCVVATFWRQEWNGSLSAHWRIHGRTRGMAVICGTNGAFNICQQHWQCQVETVVFLSVIWAKDLQTATQLGYSCKTRAFF